MAKGRAVKGFWRRGREWVLGHGILFAYLFVFSLLFVLVFPSFLSKGMFLDGLVYSNLAHQLHNHNGTFWHTIQYYGTESPFVGHPPLAWGLQSAFFHIFGDNIYADKLFSLATCLVSYALVAAIWRRLTGAMRTAWLPLFLLFLVPLISWSLTNNILENTMMMFVLASILLILKSLEGRRFLRLFLAGCCLYLSFITKFFTGLFPLALPLLLFLFVRKTSLPRCLVDTLVVVASFTLCLGFVAFVFPDSWQNLKTVLFVQVMPSLRGEAAKVESHFWIAKRLVCELLVPLAVCAVLVFVGRRKGGVGKVASEDAHLGWAFLLLGLSGSLPLMLTLKQAGMYMLCAFPCFALAFALFVRKPVEAVASRISEKWQMGLSVFSVLLCCAAIGLNASQIGRYGRDKTMQRDIELVSRVIPDKTVVATSSDLAGSWSLINYLSREYDITLEQCAGCQREYMLLPKGATAPASYRIIALPTSDYDVYRLEAAPL